MKLFVGLAVVMALAGCSTSPVTVNNADPVPASRLHAFSGKSDAKLIVTRDTGLYGSGVNYSIYIDGTLAADFASGEVAAFGIKSGKHILGIQPATMFAGTMHEAEIDVKPGDLIRRRISLDGGGFYLTPTNY